MKFDQAMKPGDPEVISRKQKAGPSLQGKSWQGKVRVPVPEQAKIIVPGSYVSED